MKPKSNFAEHAFRNAGLISLSPMPDEERLGGEGVEFFPANGAFICPRVLEGYRTIKFSTEPLRTHPRRSDGVLEVCSPLILKLVRCLVLPTPLMAIAEY